MWHAPRLSPASALLGTLVAIWVNLTAAAIDDRCGACKSVVDALSVRLANEPVKNHLDMRHRLASDGKRQGKVIDYKVSELRVSELLDDLCEDMDTHFRWATHMPTADKPVEWRWLRVKGPGAAVGVKPAGPSNSESKARARELKTYCYGLVESAEDAFTAFISLDAPRQTGLDEHICIQTTRHCSPTAAGEETVHLEL